MEEFGIKLISTAAFFNRHFFFWAFENSGKCQMVLKHNGTSADKCVSLIKKLIVQFSS